MQSCSEVNTDLIIFLCKKKPEPQDDKKHYVTLDAEHSLLICLPAWECGYLACYLIECQFLKCQLLWPY